MAEREGIVAWMVEGRRQYKKIGLATPQEVIWNTLQYEQNSDVQGEFFSKCVHGKDCSIRLEALFKKYRDWCNEIDETPRSYQDFAGFVESRGFEVKRRISEHGRPQYVKGLGWPGHAETLGGGGEQPVTEEVIF